MTRQREEFSRPTRSSPVPMNCALCDFARALKCVGGADRSQKLQVANFSGEDHRCRHGRIRSRLMTFCPECPSGLQLLHPDGSTFVTNCALHKPSSVISVTTLLAAPNCGRWKPPLRRTTIPSCVRTMQPPSGTKSRKSHRSRSPVQASHVAVVQSV
jgi:hypothetical protein